MSRHRQCLDREGSFSWITESCPLLASLFLFYFYLAISSSSFEGLLCFGSKD